MDINKKGLVPRGSNQKNITALVQEKPLYINGTSLNSVSQAPIYEGGKNGY